MKGFTRKDVAQRISEHQDLLIIYENRVYRLNQWIKHHPGGSLVILHMIGKDATDEINAYHRDEILREKFPLFCIGELTDPSTNSNERTIRQAFRQLHYKLRFLGLFKCNFVDYFREFLRYIFLAFWATFFFFNGENSWNFYFSAFFLGALWHQLTFTAHDAGHLAITNSYRIDSWIGIFIANCLGGISIGWWKNHHNVHHIVTNSPEHDPDIQHLPFFAITPRFLQSIYSTYHRRILRYDCLAALLVPLQHWTYYFIMCFARFNLQFQSYVYLYKSRRSPFRSIEIVSICFFWFWFLSILFYIPTNIERFFYVFISYVVTMPLHVQITLSHFGMSTDDFGPEESFPSKMLRTTMDIACPSWLDFFHGGLQFQAVHHLFPRMPRHSLRSASPFVQQFAEQVGLQYHIYGFVHGNAKVLGVLKDVAEQIKLLHRVAKEFSE